jgi:subtilase family serine protease
VQRFLEKHDLKVSAVGGSNLYVRAEGTVRDIQNAFHVEIHNLRVGNTVLRANTADPWIEEPAGSQVAAISGLSEHHMNPHHVLPIDPDTSAPFQAIPIALLPNGYFFSAQCFREAQRQTFTTNGGSPEASYFGNRYGADITNSALGTLAPCGYQPSELQTAYGLNSLYAAGLDGTGQTIVIVDAYGSPTILQDAELFSQLYGLPDLTSSNFQIYYPGGPPTTQDQGWATEVSLDVEWAHSVAPKANIALMIAPTSNDPDLQAAILFAIHHHLGNVISNSYGEAEADVPPALLRTWNRISRLGAARGISVNFSSGDSGDSNPSGFTPGLVFPGVSTPADSPWATAVGGTSLAVKSDNTIAFQTGWGNNITRIANTIAQGSTPVIPPLLLGFQGGSGGGTSDVFEKPRFQSGLPGAHRLVPDIAYLADAFTGVEVICDGSSCGGPPGPAVGVIGGTSLSCPMFSAMWSIANQKAGERLGQAARLLYSLPADAITDIVPVGSEDNARGTIKTAAGRTRLSPQALAQPLENTRTFYSALYNSPFSTRWFVLTFGTDSSLVTTEGWDNVTGLGTPNGSSFVEAVAEASHSEN